MNLSDEDTVDIDISTVPTAVAPVVEGTVETKPPQLIAVVCDKIPKGIFFNAVNISLKSMNT